MAFKDRLKEARIAKNIKQKELADMIGGITGNTISNYENGVSSPSVEIMQKMFDALKVTPNYMFQDDVDIQKIIERKRKFDTPTYVIGENGEREVRYTNTSDDALLEEMGIRKTNYIISKENIKTELSDNEYDFLINSLDFFRKK